MKRIALVLMLVIVIFGLSGCWGLRDVTNPDYLSWDHPNGNHQVQLWWNEAPEGLALGDHALVLFTGSNRNQVVEAVLLRQGAGLQLDLYFETGLIQEEIEDMDRWHVAGFDNPYYDTDQLDPLVPYYWDYAGYLNIDWNPNNGFPVDLNVGDVIVAEFDDDNQTFAGQCTVEIDPEWGKISCPVPLNGQNVPYRHEQGRFWTLT